jgi:hypothetical protein
MPSFFSYGSSFERVIRTPQRRDEARAEPAVEPFSDDDVVFDWEYSAEEVAGMNAGTGEHSVLEQGDAELELDQDMEEQGSVLSDTNTGSHTSEASTGPAAVELWYRSGAGWEEESGLLVQPGISDGSVRLCCPEIRLRNGATHFHWAVRVDRCLQVSVRRLMDGSFEQSCSCENNILNTGLAAEG